MPPQSFPFAAHNLTFSARPPSYNIGDELVRGKRNKVREVQDSAGRWDRKFLIWSAPRLSPSSPLVFFPFQPSGACRNIRFDQGWRGSLPDPCVLGQGGWIGPEVAEQAGGLVVSGEGRDVWILSVAAKLSANKNIREKNRNQHRWSTTTGTRARQSRYR